MFFPRQDVPELKKDQAWCARHLDYAQKLIKQYNPLINRHNRLYQLMNGKTESAAIAYLTSTYQKKNRTRYVDYRIARPKMDIVANEWLKRPLNATVHTINAEAKSQKLDNYNLMLGASAAKQQINFLRQKGVDPTQGMEVPDLDDEEAWNKLSVKDKNESLMQTILNVQIKELDMKTRLHKNYQDLGIVSMVYGKVDINEKGDVTYLDIDPRDAIYEEVDRDPFMKRSPLMGSRLVKPIHEILRTYDLTDSERNLLDSIRNKSLDFLSDKAYKNSFYFVGGQLCAEVIHIEWKSVSPIYSKISPKTKAQLFADDTTTTITKELDTEEYERNTEKYAKDVAAGKYEIVTKWKEELWEATRIGGIINTRCRRKPFILRRVDNPSEVLDYSYCGMLFNTIDGERVSLLEIMENFSNAYNVVMYQLMKEVNVAKGKIIVYDQAGQPRKKNVKDVMYQAINDGFLEWDSSAIGNMGGRNLDATQLFKVLDIGVSSSFQSLVMMKQDIVASLDRISGVNQERTGDIAASSTATNAQSSIQASRTITDAMTHYMARYSENVLMKIVESTKVSWGLYKSEMAKIILGDDKFNFMIATKDMAYSDYAVYITDGGKELEIRQKIDQYAETLFNGKMVTLHEMIDVQLSETLVESRNLLEKAYDKAQKMQQESAMQQEQASNEGRNQGIMAELQWKDKDREDRQNHDKEMLILKSKLEDQHAVRRSEEDIIKADHDMKIQGGSGMTGGGGGYSASRPTVGLSEI